MRLLITVIAVTMGLFVQPVAAHPHIWIDGTIDLELDSRGLRSFEVSWLFDEFNSAEMITMFDDDRDGTISPPERERFRTEAFEHLRSLDYFVVAFSTPRSGSRTGSRPDQRLDRLGIPDAEQFSASVQDGRLLYRFVVPLRMHWSDLEGLVLAFFDPSYFTDFLSEADRETYVQGNHHVQLTRRTLRLESEGWGTIHVPALQLGLR